ncbi:MAG: c-type cytochrome [Opitutaceae bacterium]|nr:c-type cytochrome [Opitutaceae bacterium]
MKNAPVFLFGLLAALTISWAGIVLGSHAQLGALAPYFDDGDQQSYPFRQSGIAARGQLVYAELGCASCHTQQVRRPGYGSDQARGWGDRQSVARDYIHQIVPQLGGLRLGPDLANLAARKPNAPAAEDLMKLLYLGSPTHPAYRFLFQERQISGQRSLKALPLAGRDAPAANYEIVPTEQAQSLVSYLLSLNHAFVYPEARPAPKETKAGAPAHAAPKETPVPAAAPDEKKKTEGAKK